MHPSIHPPTHLAIQPSIHLAIHPSSHPSIIDKWLRSNRISKYPAMMGVGFDPRAWIFAAPYSNHCGIKAPPHSSVGNGSCEIDAFRWFIRQKLVHTCMCTRLYAAVHRTAAWSKSMSAVALAALELKKVLTVLAVLRDNLCTTKQINTVSGHRAISFRTPVDSKQLPYTRLGSTRKL